MSVSREAIRQYEVSELEGAISLETLASMAEVLDCELIVGLRHKSGSSFARLIWNQLCPEIFKHHWVKSRPPEAKGLALAAVARDLFENPQFRRRKGWICNQRKEGD